MARVMDSREEFPQLLRRSHRYYPHSSITGEGVPHPRGLYPRWDLPNAAPLRFWPTSFTTLDNGPPRPGARLTPDTPEARRQAVRRQIQAHQPCPQLKTRPPPVETGNGNPVYLSIFPLLSLRFARSILSPTPYPRKKSASDWNPEDQYCWWTPSAFATGFRQRHPSWNNSGRLIRNAISRRNRKGGKITWPRC